VENLVALAALAATTAFAQSSVTIGGTLEVAPVRSTKLSTQTGAVTTDVKGSNLGQHNTWSTSVLSISGVEDLGGGLKASAVMISGVGDGFAARERTLGLSGDFGALRFGRFVPAAAAGFHAFSQTGSATLVGSVYGMSTASTGAIDAATRGNLHNSAANFERQDNVLQYTSPTFSGFTVNVALVNNSSDSNAAALAGKTEGKQTSVHVGYAAGPLSAGIGFNSRTDGTEGTAAVAPVANTSGTVGGSLGSAAVAATTGTSTDTDLQWIGASYNLGVATLFATNVTREAKTKTGAAAAATGTDASVNSFGVSVPMGALTLRASTYTGKDKQTAAANDNMKLSGNQVSVSYALSKRTSLIAATGTNQIKRDGAASTADTRKISGTTLTVNHTF
jgi:predicted porin